MYSFLFFDNHECIHLVELYMIEKVFFFFEKVIEKVKQEVMQII